MTFASSEQVLMRVALFGIAVSVMSTCMISLLLVTDNGDYSFDEIQDYRNELSQFTGESMLNQTPWVLTDVLTPYDGLAPGETINDHVDNDGWLYGERVPYTTYIGKSANIKLAVDHKSSVPITYADTETPYTVVSGVKWWADSSAWYGILVDTVFRPIGEFFGEDPNTYAQKNAHAWNYTGYRYVFDPTLPFKYDENGDATKTSVRDGTLSIVWYNYQTASGSQEGLSGGLDVYGGRVLLASYAATDIIAAYNSTSGYATTYDFNFEGTHLNLSIRFDQDAIERGQPLMEAWTAGNWELAISSISAGNFYDIENSTSFTATAGNMIQTFIQIYTLDLPSINNPWMDLILWLIVGLPMTLAMLFLTLRIIDTAKPKLFG